MVVYSYANRAISCDLEMNKREQNRKNKRTEIEKNCFQFFNTVRHSQRQESARKGLNTTSGAQFAALPLVKPVI